MHNDMEYILDGSLPLGQDNAICLTAGHKIGRRNHTNPFYIQRTTKINYKLISFSMHFLISVAISI